MAGVDTQRSHSGGERRGLILRRLGAKGKARASHLRCARTAAQLAR